MLNYYYSDEIHDFRDKSSDTIIGEISRNSRHGHITTELYAWETQIEILQKSLNGFSGKLYFEFSIPRMGKRVDCLLIIENIVFVVEFKVGEKEILNQDIEQVWDYALDLKNFHKPSHDLLLVPILVATNSEYSPFEIISSNQNDNLVNPIVSNATRFKEILNSVLEFFSSNDKIDDYNYINGSYSPTPTIIEAAISLYNSHNVEEITRSDSSAKNLKTTTKFISETIEYAKKNHKKIICFVTGVPGAGKTLVGLKIATEHLDNQKGNKSVFLSGNKPLVDVLHEALTRDKVIQEKAKGNKITKKTAKESVKAFIQMVHHYRDEYLRDKKAPYDHVAIFDEAQRAWTKEQTIKFMREKKNVPNFKHSEPEFLISCLDRHPDWAVIVCLVGGGQEINTGEAGISEWLKALKNEFPNWQARISSKLYDSEYDTVDSIHQLKTTNEIVFNDDLHLSVSMRSFRSEFLSKFIKELLDINPTAIETFKSLKNKYPIVITRDISKAKNWLKNKARGSERYGLVVSSQAYRLKPIAIDVRPQINHVNWFLNDKEDVRSSYFLEDAVTEFQVQGLELDWACVVWDGDLRFSYEGWKYFSFKGSKWQNVKKEIRQKYLLNAYRVLLTRARQGMVIVVPDGDTKDYSRQPDYYDPTFEYLLELGILEI